MAEAYWFESDFEAVKGDDLTVTQEWTTIAGVAVDISAWTFAFNATESADGGTGSFSIPDGSFTKSDSGSGVTDTVQFEILGVTTAQLNEGRYKYDVSATVGGDKTTYQRGTFTIQRSESD
jgi:hypothetical protein